MMRGEEVVEGAEAQLVCLEKATSLSRVVPILDHSASGGGHGAQEDDQQLELQHPHRNSDVSGSPEDWLPITQSRKGNSFTAAFHLMCSGMGIQSLVAPLAFVSLGWVGGSVCLSVAFGWQLYTTWLLVQLHQPPSSSSKRSSSSSSSAPRYSRYVVLSIIAFGPKLGKLLAMFPTMYLSGGSCVMFIITGGRMLELLSELLFSSSSAVTAVTGAAWFLVFVCMGTLVSLFYPTLDSLAPVSLLGSLSAVLYFSLLWIVSVVTKGTTSTSTTRLGTTTNTTNIRGIFDAIGMLALTFRGHNLVLEIQGTMDTNPRRRPARNPMMKGVGASTVVIASCIFPLAIGGYWAYGNSIRSKDHKGILDAFAEWQRRSANKWIVGTVYVGIVMHLICSFPLYGMPALDNLERIYVTRKNRACPKWLRSAIRLFFGAFTYFIALAFPFLGSLGPFIGALTLPLTLAYPCLMWVAIEKPNKSWTNPARSFNLGLASLGILLSFLLAAAALWNLVDYGLVANFFKPR